MRLVILLALAAACARPGARPAAGPQPPPGARSVVLGREGMVASAHPLATLTGVEILRRGGTAVDAAIAVNAVLAVVEPMMCGPGGDLFAQVWDARTGRLHGLNASGRAPRALTADRVVPGPDGSIPFDAPTSWTVPGAVDGWFTLHERFGRLPMQELLAPAIRAATEGTPVPRVIAAEWRAAGGPGYAETFLPAPAEGALFRNPALARTLTQVAEGGRDAFYRGPIAEEIVKAVRAAGGVMTLEDLAGYAPVERAPIATTYRGFRVFTMPPPSSGGVVITQALGILSQKLPEPPRGPGRFSSAYLHLFVEALKHGFADRARHLGDPDFSSLPLDRLLDPAYHRELATRVQPDRVLPPERYGMPPGPGSPPRDGGTAHLSVIDAEGNAVALTTTINLWFGAHLVAGRTGVLLNNEIDDFSIAADTPNAFGLVGRDRNFVAPKKRPLSSMSPTIVLEGDRIKMAVGGAGGPTIISSTLAVLLNVLDGQLDAQEASASPRVHHQWNPDVLSLEPEIPPDVVEGLERRGHKTRVRDHISKVNVVVRAGDRLEAAAELRGGGLPAGY